MAIAPNLVKFSRQLRKEQTPWEKILWARLKGKKFKGLKFKRQVVIGPYIVDFSCFEKMLIIELDGSEHAEDLVRRNDEARTRFLESKGYEVLRFWNNDIDSNLEGVLEKIRAVISQ